MIVPARGAPLGVMRGTSARPDPDRSREQDGRRDRPRDAREPEPPHEPRDSRRSSRRRGALPCASVKRIDLSHPIVPGMKTYPGLPVPEAHVFLDYEESRVRYGGEAEFFIASLHLCGNTGTYVDAPRHRFRDGPDLAALSLDRLAHLPVVLVDVRDLTRATPPTHGCWRRVTGRRGRSRGRA